MAETHRSRSLAVDTAADYRIQVQGNLDASWSDRLSGVAIVTDRQPGKVPITTLTGEFIDQAALSGALDTLYDLGMPLLLVECLRIADPRKED